MAKRRNLSKSAQTRVRIQDAARALFAEHGYEGTSIRDVAMEASCDPALVMRYFGSKDGLFAAAVNIDLMLPQLEGIDPSYQGIALVKHFLNLWESSDSAPVLIILLRSAVATEMAAERLRSIFVSQVLPAFALSGESEKSEVRAGLIASQLLGLALSRYILEIPPVARMSHDEIVTKVGPTIQGYLEG